jgi:hypothetical protein
MANSNTSFQIPFGALVGGENETRIKGNLIVEGDLSTSGVLSYTQTSLADIIPNTDKNDLGNTLKRWDLFAYDANVANLLNVGGLASFNETLSVTKTFSSGNSTTTGFSNVSGVLTANGNTSLTNSLLTVNTDSGTNANTLTVGAANVSVDSGVLFVDAVNNRVGVNNTAPDTSLRVIGTVGANDAHIGNSTSNVHISNTGILIGGGASSTGLRPTSNTTGATGGLGNSTATWSIWANSINITNGITANGTINADDGGFIGSSFVVQAIGTSSDYLIANASGIHTTQDGTVIGSASKRFELFGNTLDVSNATALGNTTITGQFSATGNGAFGANIIFNVANERITVGNSQTNTVITKTGITSNGTLSIQGNATLSGSLQTISGNVNIDSGVLYVDSISNKVGINNTAPDSALRVTGDVDISANLLIRSFANVSANLNVLDSANISNTTTSKTLVTNNTIVLSGTVTVPGNTTVTGSGTNFTQVLVTGDEIVFDGCTSIFTVQSITNSTSLTLSSTGPNLIGVTLDKLVKFVSNTSGIISSSGIRASGNLTTNGVLNSILGNTNFDSGTLFVDATNNRVGINNTTPSVALQVTGTANATTFTVDSIGSSNGFLANSTVIALGNNSVNVQIYANGNMIFAGDGSNTTSVQPSTNGYLLGLSDKRWDIFAANISVTNVNSNNINFPNTGGTIRIGTGVNTSFITNSSVIIHTGAATLKSLELVDNNDSGVNFVVNSSLIRMPFGFSANSSAAVLSTLFVANSSGLYTTSNGVVVKPTTISVGAGTSNTELASSAVTSPVLNVINTTSTYLIANTTHSRVAGVLLANNSAGSSGHILYSAGSGANSYWAAPPSGTEAATPSTIVGRDINGAIFAVNFYATSDAVLKENINNIDVPEKILNLSAKQYNFKGNDSIQYGFVAQDVEKIIPEMVSDSGKFKAINYIQMIAMLVEVVKKQDQRIKNLEEK